MTRSESVRVLKAAVRRDLEWLLNTRQPNADVRDGTELRRSLFAYGLPELTNMVLSSPRDRQRVLQAIESAVATFEPRLANVRVTLMNVSAERVPQVRFLIEGLLRIDPNPEQVSFDTLLELSSGEYKIQGEFGA